MNNRLYNATKVLHFPDKLQAMQAGRVSAPIHIRLKPTNRCQHRCGYCCYRNPNLPLSELMNEKDEIPGDKLMEIVEDCVRMGVRAVTFSGGGEPLCHPRLAEAVERLAAGGVRMGLLTNGGLLRGALAGALGRSLTWVRVSMDAADRDSYARARSVGPGEFDAVCANIRGFAAQKSPGCELGISFVVTRDNSGDVFKFLALARDMGAAHVKVSAAVVGTGLEENAAYVRPILQTVKEQIARAASTLAGRSFAVVDHMHAPDAGDADGYAKPYAWCPFLHCLTVVAADLNVYTCQDKAYTRSGWLGSLQGRSFAELWRSEELRQRLKALNPGRDCRHHCVAHRKNLMLLDYFEADQAHLDFV